MPAREPIFLDTSYVVALMGTEDEYHQSALAWAAWIKQYQLQMFTHDAVLTEIGDGFSRPARRRIGIDVLERFSRDPRLEIAPVDATLRLRALELYGSRLDKDWGLTDCMSFVLMTDRGITCALTTDQHFVQAGFRALLGEQPPA